MAGMSRKEINTVLRGLKAQGCELVPSRNGTVVRFPSGRHTSFHYSQSDTNDRKYSRALVRRNGLEWPLDGQTARRDSRMGRPRNETQWQAVRDYVREQEVSFGMTAHSIKSIATATGVDQQLVRKAMAEDGYAKIAGSRAWGKIEKDHAEVPKAEPTKVVVPGYGHTTQTFERMMSGLMTGTEPEPEKFLEAKPEEREFIDTHDSWVIDNTESIRDLTVYALYSAYQAAGLKMEIRVWKSQD